MGIRVTRYPDTRKYVSLVNRMPSEVATLGMEIRAEIIRRTQNGLDKNNRSFKKYSDEYKKAKAQEFGSARPNLTRTQAMLNGMDMRKIKGGFRIDFPNKMENKKAVYNQRVRPFFGLDKEQRKKVLQFLKNKFNKV